MFSKNKNFANPPPARIYWVGFSGGLDSTVLLHRLKREGFKPRAVHVHHGLQIAADDWAQHCRAFCKKLKIPFTLVRVHVAAKSKAGPEAAARAARYVALRRQMKKDDCLVTAHHVDDQAETLLLRLLRGSGVQGLAAMRVVSDFPPGKLWRPLLQVPRDQIRAYASQQKLDWIEDPQNLNPRYARSWLRSELMPRIRLRYPAASSLLGRTAQHCADTLDLLDELARQDLTVTLPAGRLSVSGLLSSSPARRNNLLRYWLRQEGHEPPPAELLVRLENEVLRARADSEPVLAWGDSELRRYRDELWVMPRLPPLPCAARLRWDGRKELRLPAGCGELRGRSTKPISRLELRFQQGGEKLKRVGDSHTRTLKNLCQAAGIPPWVRARMPLLFRDGKLIAVSDRWLSAEAMELKLGLKWRHPLEAFSAGK